MSDRFFIRNVDISHDGFPERYSVGDEVPEWVTEEICSPNNWSDGSDLFMDADEQFDSYEKMTVNELKAELATRNLPTNGNKGDLVERLQKNDVARMIEKEAQEQA